MQELHVAVHRAQLFCSVFKGSKVSNAAESLRQETVQEDIWGVFIFFLASHNKGRSIQELEFPWESCVHTAGRAQSSWEKLLGATGLPAGGWSCSASETSG